MFNLTTKFDIENNRDSVDVISITDGVKNLVTSYSKSAPGNAYILADEHLAILEGKVTATKLPQLKLELLP